jgi:hypothetical protein
VFQPQMGSAGHLAYASKVTRRQNYIIVSTPDGRGASNSFLETGNFPIMHQAAISRKTRASNLSVEIGPSFQSALEQVTPCLMFRSSTNRESKFWLKRLPLL